MFKNTPLTRKNILDAINTFKDNEHFQCIAKARLLLLDNIRQQLDTVEGLEWTFTYTPVNTLANRVKISLKDPEGRFDFFLAIPLLLNYELHLYLGDHTFNFFEAYPLLISKSIFAEGDYPVKATSRIMAHLVVSGAITRYEQQALNSIETDNDCTAVDQRILDNIKESLEKFIPPLNKIISGEWRLNQK